MFRRAEGRAVFAGLHCYRWYLGETRCGLPLSVALLLPPQTLPPPHTIPTVTSRTPDPATSNRKGPVLPPKPSRRSIYKITAVHKNGGFITAARMFQRAEGRAVFVAGPFVYIIYTYIHTNLVGSMRTIATYITLIGLRSTPLGSPRTTLGNQQRGALNQTWTGDPKQIKWLINLVGGRTHDDIHYTAARNQFFPTLKHAGSYDYYYFSCHPTMCSIIFNMDHS